MAGWRISWNGGMVAAGVLLLIGAGTMLLAPEENRLLHQAGFAVVLLAGVVYLGARIAMLLRDRRR